MILNAKASEREILCKEVVSLLLFIEKIRFF